MWWYDCWTANNCHYSCWHKQRAGSVSGGWWCWWDPIAKSWRCQSSQDPIGASLSLASEESLKTSHCYLQHKHGWWQSAKHGRHGIDCRRPVMAWIIVNVYFQSTQIPNENIRTPRKHTYICRTPLVTYVPFTWKRTPYVFSSQYEVLLGARHLTHIRGTVWHMWHSKPVYHY
jgi:hypothetical protein